MLQPEVCFVASLARLMLAQKDIKMTGKVLNKLKNVCLWNNLHFHGFFISFRTVFRVLQSRLNEFVDGFKVLKFS